MEELGDLASPGQSPDLQVRSEVTETRQLREGGSPSPSPAMTVCAGEQTWTAVDYMTGAQRCIQALPGPSRLL